MALIPSRLERRVRPHRTCWHCSPGLDGRTESPWRHTCRSRVMVASDAANRTAHRAFRRHRLPRSNSLAARNLRGRTPDLVGAIWVNRACESARVKAHYTGIFQPSRTVDPMTFGIRPKTSSHFYIQIGSIAGGNSRAIDLLTRDHSRRFQRPKSLGRWLRSRLFDEATLSIA